MTSTSAPDQRPLAHRMEISSPRYTENSGYPFLTLSLDGVEYSIAAEQKPTLTANGIVWVDTGFPGSTELGGVEFSHTSDDPQLFEYYLAFALDCRHGRFKAGGVPDPSAIDQGAIAP